MVLAASAGGGVTDTRTTLAMSTAQAKEVFAATGKLTSSFRSAGGVS